MAGWCERGKQMREKKNNKNNNIDMGKQAMKRTKFVFIQRSVSIQQFHSSTATMPTTMVAPAQLNVPIFTIAYNAVDDDDDDDDSDVGDDDDDDKYKASFNGSQFHMEGEKSQRRKEESERERGKK